MTPAILADKPTSTAKTVLLLIFYLLIAMFPYLDSKAAEDCKIMAGVSVCLNGEGNVDVLVNDNFTLSNVPTGSTITWQASGFATILTGNGGKIATINWAGNQDPTRGNAG